MKRYHIMLKSALVSSLMLLFFAVISADANNQSIGTVLNHNGSFEDSDPGEITEDVNIDGWHFNGLETLANFEITKETAQHGTHSLKIKILEESDNAWDIEATATDIPVEPGKEYIYSVWIKSQNSGATANFTVGNYDYQEYYRIDNSDVLIDTVWQHFTFNFTIDDDSDVVRAPIHFSFDSNLDNTIYIDNMYIVEKEEYEEVAKPIVAEAESGVVGTDFDILDDAAAGITFVRCTTDGADFDPDIWDRPGTKDRIITYEITFPEAGEYNLFVRGRVGEGNWADDSFFYGVEFGENDPDNADHWSFANGLVDVGFNEPNNYVHEAGGAPSQTWIWMNISQNEYHNQGFTYFAEEDGLTVKFQIGGREDNFDIDKIAFGRVGVYYTVEDLDSLRAGSLSIPPVEVYAGPPLATGHDKWLGSAHGSQPYNFEAYWNQVTPGNAGKWGSVQPTQDSWNWRDLDESYNLAKDNGYPFRFHVLVWGNQQPPWMPDLADNPAKQLEAIEDWFTAVAERYSDIDYLEVVNEPLHDPPDADPNNTGAGNYIEALGGTGETGWDWILNAFRMARQKFPESTKLVINDYGILGSNNNVNSYLEIVDLLDEEDLIDVIGMQGHYFTVQDLQPDVLIRRLDELATRNIPLMITEFDLAGDRAGNSNLTQEESDQNQLDAFLKIFPALWHHPDIIGVTLWGYGPGAGGWRAEHERHLMNLDKTERPALVFLREYLAGDVKILTMERQQGQGTVTPSPGRDLYNTDEVVNITANADEGWKFSHWEGNVDDSNSNETAITMNDDQSVKAVFIEETVNEIAEKHEKDAMLLTNYPNPFSDHTNIKYSINTTANATLEVYDLQGKLLQTLVNKEKSPGKYNVSFNSEGFSNGVYFYRLKAGNDVDMKKMIIIK